MRKLPLYLQSRPQIFLTAPPGTTLSLGERHFNGFWWGLANLDGLRFPCRVQFLAHAINQSIRLLLTSAPPSQRTKLFTLVESMQHGLNCALLNAGYAPRLPPPFIHSYLAIPPLDQEKLCEILVRIPSLQRLDLLEHGLVQLFIQPFFMQSATDFDVQNAYEIVQDLAATLDLPLAILRRSLYHPPIPVPLADGFVYGPLPPSLATSEVMHSRYPPVPPPPPLPPPLNPPPTLTRPCLERLILRLTYHLHARITAPPGSLKSLIDHEAIKLMVRGIRSGAIPLPSFISELYEDSRPTVASSPPSLHIDTQLVSPFSNIGGPSHKSFIPVKLTAGSRRRVLTRRAFLSPPRSNPLSIPPYAHSSRRRLLERPLPFTSPPSSPHHAWEPLLHLKLGDVGWDPRQPLPLAPPPRVSAWEGRLELLLKLGDVGWGAFAHPRPPRPDPP